MAADMTAAVAEPVPVPAKRLRARVGRHAHGLDDKEDCDERDRAGGEGRGRLRRSMQHRVRRDLTVLNFHSYGRLSAHANTSSGSLRHKYRIALAVFLPLVSRVLEIKQMVAFAPASNSGRKREEGKKKSEGLIETFDVCGAEILLSGSPGLTNLGARFLREDRDPVSLPRKPTAPTYAFDCQRGVALLVARFGNGGGVDSIRDRFQYMKTCLRTTHAKRTPSMCSDSFSRNSASASWKKYSTRPRSFWSTIS